MNESINSYKYIFEVNFGKQLSNPKKVSVGLYDLMISVIKSYNGTIETSALKEGTDIIKLKIPGEE